jgi:5,10-methylene-tetrahydrofolate dehydrogenase/methenyl tetrahydrofolate cyclohydrolase
MPSKILDGKALAQLAEEDIKSHVSTLKENGITPTLATILVGGGSCLSYLCKNEAKCLCQAWHGFNSS